MQIFLIYLSFLIFHLLKFLHLAVILIVDICDHTNSYGMFIAISFDVCADKALFGIKFLTFYFFHFCGVETTISRVEPLFTKDLNGDDKFLFVYVELYFSQMFMLREHHSPCRWIM